MALLDRSSALTAIDDYLDSVSSRTRASMVFLVVLNETGSIVHRAWRPGSKSGAQPDDDHAGWIDALEAAVEAQGLPGSSDISGRDRQGLVFATSGGSVGLAAVDADVTLASLFGLDELGDVLPWALVLSHPAVRSQDLEAEIQSAPSPSAYLALAVGRLAAHAGILWIKDDGLSTSDGRGVESRPDAAKQKLTAGCTRSVPSGSRALDVPYGRGMVGQLTPSDGPQVVDLATANVYNRAMINAAGWRYAITCPIVAGGRLAGVLSLYFRAEPSLTPVSLLRVADYARDGVPHARRLRVRLVRELETRLFEQRLEKLQVGVEVLAFAHDLATSAKGIYDGQAYLKNWLESTGRQGQTYQLVNGLTTHVDVTFQLTRAMIRLIEGRHNETERFDLAGEIVKMETVLRALAPDIQFRMESALFARGNILDFQRIVINLVSNASYWVKKKAEIISEDDDVTHSPGAPISITVKPVPSDHDRDRYADVIVADTGPGMTDFAKRHAFDLLFTQKDRGEGLGVGLWVVKKLAGEFEEGQVDIFSVQGRGSTVRFRLRLAS